MIAMNPSSDPRLETVPGPNTMQAAVLAAAIDGNQQVRGQLPQFYRGFEEPYRTVAAEVVNKIKAGKYLDRHTLAHDLESCRLSRHLGGGIVETLKPQEVVNLLFAEDVQPGQAEAYLPVLRQKLQAKKQAETKESLANLVDLYGDRPRQMLAEMGRVAAEAYRNGDAVGGNYPAELLEVIPYTNTLVQRQQGKEFLGLNTGFPHFNYLCNGLDTGLGVIAAPPGSGKTTLLWQIGCQVAELNHVPVIFISMEQSKTELRAKALARLSKLQYRHILRGRLRADDPEDMQTLFAAMGRYTQIAPYLTIVEGDDGTTIDKISEIASQKIAQAGAPRGLILVDYLQVIPLRKDDGPRATNTKDRVDLHVSALRRMARDLDSPVVVISSENRAGYKSKHMDVFKESGGIEYSADLAMILTRSKNGNPNPDNSFRLMDLNIVKNRNGERGVVEMKFYPERSEFIETGKKELVEEADE
jgi:replicative DNA helicase